MQTVRSFQPAICLHIRMASALSRRGTITCLSRVTRVHLRESHLTKQVYCLALLTYAPPGVVGVISWDSRSNYHKCERS